MKINKSVLNRKKLIFMVFLVIGLFSVVSFASGQDSYNIFTLEYFKQSLESLIIGDYDSAIRNSSLVISRDPNSSVAYTIRGRAYYEKGEMTNAINDCTRAISLDRNNVSALSIRANAYIRAGNFTRAITDWETLLRISPENTDALRNIELAQRQQSAP